jgi:hypothetical protein
MQSSRAWATFGLLLMFIAGPGASSSSSSSSVAAASVTSLQQQRAPISRLRMPRQPGRQPAVEGGALIPSPRLLAPSPSPPPHSDANLSALKVSAPGAGAGTCGALTPNFTPDTVNYHLSASADLTEVMVTAVLSDLDAELHIQSTRGTSGEGMSVPLSPAGMKTNITIDVSPGVSPTDPDKMYTIVVARQSKPAPAPAPPSPPPGPPGRKYSCQIMFGRRSCQEASTANSTLAACDATCCRQPPCVPPPPHSDANLSALKVSAPGAGAGTCGALTPTFTPDTVNYHLSASADLTEVMVTAVLSDLDAELHIQSTRGTSGEGMSVPLSPAGTTTPITIDVSPGDSPTDPDKTYTIAVARQSKPPPPAPPPPHNEDNTLLRSLTVDKGELSPPFNPRIDTFDDYLPVGTTVVHVSATSNSSLATVDISPGAGGGPTPRPHAESTVAVQAGKATTIVNITVFGQSGISSMYQLQLIARPAPGPRPPSPAPPTPSLPSVTHTHTHTRARTHTRALARARARAHTQSVRGG